MTSGIERRRARRFVVSLPVRSAAQNTESVFAVTRDISSAGVYFYTEADDWTEGKQVEFVLELPSEVTLTDPAVSRCRATVLRTERVESVLGVALRIDRFTFARGS
jgi:hypothetical protein